MDDLRSRVELTVAREHDIAARTTAAYYTSLVDAGIPEDLARVLIRDWHWQFTASTLGLGEGEWTSLTSPESSTGTAVPFLSSNLGSPLT